MVKSLIYHKVANFEAWKKEFDSFYKDRKLAGERSYSIGHLKGDPSTAYVINEWDDLASYEAFLNSPELSEKMKNAGVMEAPHSIIFEELNKG